MEKMTVLVSAVLHGDSEVLGETETWEAETREELAERYVAFLRGLADEVEDGVLTAEQKRERASALLREANAQEGYDAP